MKQLFIILFAACLLYACNNKPAATSDDKKIIAGTIDSVKSTILHETRKIWVYVPDSYKNDTFSRQHYPVLYLLDGDAHFLSVVGMIQQLSTINGNKICPEMIVIGITNTNRTRDLTPTHVDVDAYMDSASAKPSGGGEQFTAFIEKELMPHIDSLYPTSPYKLLIGHSFGGLMVMNTFMHHTSLFNAYVAIDPSMWWDSMKLLNETKKELPGKDLNNKALFLGIANTMDAGMDTMHVQLDTAVDSKHIRSILALSHTLIADKQQGFRFAYKYYNTDNHSSVPLITEYDALHFLFSFYQFDLTNAEYSNINQAAIARIERHYDAVSAIMGFKVPPQQMFINYLAYQASAQGHHTEAEYLAKLNTTNFPGSPNGYDSLGDIYSAANNKEKAIESYKKALTITAMPDTKKKLDKLEGK